MSALALFDITRSASQADLDAVLHDVRSTGYIAEITSNEVPPEESGLWNAVVFVPLPAVVEGRSSGIGGSDGDGDGAISQLTTFTTKDLAASRGSGDWSSFGFVVVDEETLRGDGSVLVVQIDPLKSAEVARLRVARNSLIEVVSATYGFSSRRFLRCRSSVAARQKLMRDLRSPCGNLPIPGRHQTLRWEIWVC